jgi:hypothetical protein
MLAITGNSLKVHCCRELAVVGSTKNRSKMMLHIVL